MAEYALSGSIVNENFEVITGRLIIKNGLIKEVCLGRKKSEVGADHNGLILPAFINAHTHVGDSVMKDVPYAPLEKLVAPGGLKHRILETTNDAELRDAIKSTAIDMLNLGTQLFCDFREGDARGVKILRGAIKGLSIGAKVFGRPVGVNPNLDANASRNNDGADPAELMKVADGIGMSSTADYDYEYLCDLRRAAAKHKMAFALHAGERSREDIEDAIALEPDFLVHLTQAGKKELKIVADEGIPVIVCARSNFVTGMASVSRPPIAEMLAMGIKVGAGTDNVMLNSPNIFSEMEFISKIFLHDDVSTLRMFTESNAEILKENCGVIAEGKIANLVVLNEKSNNIKNVSNLISGAVRRARPDDIVSVIYKGKCLKKSL